ncbi:rhodanese-like domain-containing protein [Mesosutterella sp. AGMB02718]|uniref:Rhodanese-like domain-containing protein n=1 Tax=Mesosutterella faecium TaxID=2925194 RepID=A0ABT7IKL4_9BURK|nr:rhodanese-like domain-containing protein [Mesosutterella sp. AGMB02718]MDL2058901.1 rhodanese-like domain-containing protein [Mesosutterella sp. AGMB02718]
MVDFLYQNILLVVLIVISGGMLLWPLVTGGRKQKEVDSAGATEMINHDNAQVIDVRTEADFKAGHIAGSVNLPATVIHHHLSELDKKRPVLLVSSDGNTSMPGSLLKGMGFTVSTLKGGIKGWKAEDLPLVR